ncbi:MAG: hypothetical protein HYZ73_02575 [Elusimicrobia bacterium]|nr:hypothetical protein [Elusimicrobiota bacterium]
MAKYPEVILELIRTGRQRPWFSSSDYIEPIQRYFKDLTREERHKFKTDLVGMLERPTYLIELTEICAALDMRESCARIFAIAQKPPQRSKVDGYVIPADHVQGACIAALGRLKYMEALTWLRGLIEQRLSTAAAKPQIVRELEFSGLLFNIASLDLDAALEYLPKCVKLTWKKVLENKHSVEDLYRKAEEMNPIGRQRYKGKSLTRPVQFDGGAQHCLLAVMKERGLTGLKPVLQKVTVESDAEYDFWRNALNSLLLDFFKGEHRPSDKKTVEGQTEKLLQVIQRSS